MSAGKEYDFLIVGGGTADLAVLCEAALANGALRASPMPVHVASHTSCLAAAADAFLDQARAIPTRPPRRALMSATGPRLYRAAAPDVASLAGQIAATIGWNAVLDALYERGVRRIVELGPGQSLAAMARGPSRFDARAIDEFDSLAGTVQAAVPEPATWGMMILGFGGIGALIRRRRATPAALAV